MKPSIIDRLGLEAAVPQLPAIISHANECAESLLEELAALMAEMPEETGLEPRFVALLLIHGVPQAAAVHFIVAGKSGLFATGDAETFVNVALAGFEAVEVEDKAERVH